MTNRKRNKQLKIYLSDKEYQLFLKQVEKSNLSQTDFLIKGITNKQIIIIDGLRETIMSLKKIGVGINLISKNIDSISCQNSDNEMKEIKEEFSKINDTILKLLRRIK